VAATSIAILLTWLVAGLFILEAGLHGLLLTALVSLVGLGLWLGTPYHTVLDCGWARPITPSGNSFLTD